MVVAVVAAAILLVAAVAGLIYLCVIGWSGLTFFVACFVVIGFAAQVRASKVVGGRLRGRLATSEDQARAEGVAERLCIIGDLVAPEIVIERHPLPLSWTNAGLRRRSRVHLTTALLDRLNPAELEAVIGHELSHIAQSDAALMTLLATRRRRSFAGCVR